MMKKCKGDLEDLSSQDKGGEAWRFSQKASIEVSNASTLVSSENEQYS